MKTFRETIDLASYIERHGFKTTITPMGCILAVSEWHHGPTGEHGEQTDIIAPTWIAVRSWLGY